jgi:hypothetical protein
MCKGSCHDSFLDFRRKRVTLDSSIQRVNRGCEQEADLADLRGYEAGMVKRGSGSNPVLYQHYTLCQSRHQPYLLKCDEQKQQTCKAPSRPGIDEEKEPNDQRRSNEQFES